MKLVVIFQKLFVILLCILLYMFTSGLGLCRQLVIT